MCIQSVIERVGGWVPESTTHRGASAMREVHEDMEPTGRLTLFG
jgi:hypothetical protein